MSRKAASAISLLLKAISTSRVRPWTGSSQNFTIWYAYWFSCRDNEIELFFFDTRIFMLLTRYRIDHFICRTNNSELHWQAILVSLCCVKLTLLVILTKRLCVRSSFGYIDKLLSFYWDSGHIQLHIYKSLKTFQIKFEIRYILQYLFLLWTHW